MFLFASSGEVVFEFDIEAAAKHLVEEGQTEQVLANHCVIIIKITIIIVKIITKIIICNNFCYTIEIGKPQLFYISAA